MIEFSDLFKEKLTKQSIVNEGAVLFAGKGATIDSQFDAFMDKDGSINASLMQEDWFPEVKADIFISHAHADTKLALGVAGWLHKTFGLECFIDSIVWGYSNDLLKCIDKLECYDKERRVYDYDKRNYSTSHVHMMLATALHKMIDNTECLFFLKPSVPQITAKTTIEKTESPWIYAEIAMSRMIRRKEPDMHIRSGTRMYSLLEAIRPFVYDMEVDHLIPLNDNDFKAWSNGRHSDEFGLTSLYRLKGLLKRKQIL